MNKRDKILFLAAQPTDMHPLQLGRELREIQNEIEMANGFELVSEWAVRTQDLQEALMEYKPAIVHFSGHGGKEGIILEDDDGNNHCVPNHALMKLFSIFNKSVRLVLLNACWSGYQMEAFKEAVDFTVGMKKQVGDMTAIKFAAAFYRALAYGHSVQEAFQLATNLLELDKRAADTPVLFKRKRADASKAFFALNPTAPSMTKDKKRPPAKGPSVCLWIHGWAKRIYDDLPTVDLDWTEFFNRASRVVPTQEIWDKELFPDLQRAKRRLDEHKHGSFIDLRGKLPLTAMVAIGATFPKVGGYRFRTEQPTNDGTRLWQSDVRPSRRKFKIVTEKENKTGRDLLIALSITGNAKREITALYEQYLHTFTAMVYVEPDSGIGEGALRSDRDAVALAIHAKELIRSYKNQYDASQIHLMVYGPASYCLFLGQHLNSLGNIITYERSASGDYNDSVTLRTG